LSLQNKKHRAVRCLQTAFLFLILTGFATQAFAQEFAAPPPTGVGSGARAAGMANAFVAIADDATAASWNPAGLVQLELPEFSIVGAYNAATDRFTANYHTEFDSSHPEDGLELNFLSFVYPLPRPIWGRNISLSLNYQRKFDFGKSFDIDYDTASVFGSGTIINQFLNMEFTQKGGLGAISPAIAIELTKTLSIGATLNLWRSSPLAENDWEQTTRIRSTSFLGSRLTNLARTTREKFDDFEGENVTLGLLWNVTDRWNLAMRYDSAFTGTVDYESKTTGVRFNLNPATFLSPIAETLREEREIRFPDSLSIGAAYRRNDRLTIAMDITRTDWNDFYMKDGAGRKFSLVDASPIDDPGKRTHLKPTYSVRLGSEYVMIPKNPDERLDRLWSIRGGLFYEEEPATNKSTSNLTRRGNGKPDRFYGFTAGLGLLVKQRVNIDVAYQFRYGHGVNKDFLRGPGGFEDELFQHRFVLSSVVYFKTGR
jgi:long-subunit fatty acid transport protein